MSESLNHLLNRLDQMYGLIWEWMEMLCVALKCAKVDSDWDLNHFCCREKTKYLSILCRKSKSNSFPFYLAVVWKKSYICSCGVQLWTWISAQLSQCSCDIAQIIRRSIHQYTVLTRSLKWFGNLKGWSVFHEGKIFPNIGFRFVLEIHIMLANRKLFGLKGISV